MSHRRSDPSEDETAKTPAHELPELLGPVPLEGDRQARWAKLMVMLRAYWSSPDYKPIAEGESVARVRALRDEWD